MATYLATLTLLNPAIFREASREIIFRDSDTLSAARSAMRAGARLAAANHEGYATLGSAKLFALRGAIITAEGSLRDSGLACAWEWKADNDQGLPAPGMRHLEASPLFAATAEFQPAKKDGGTERTVVFVRDLDEAAVAASVRGFMEERHAALPDWFGPPASLTVSRMDPKPILADGCFDEACLLPSRTDRFVPGRGWHDARQA